MSIISVAIGDDIQAKLDTAVPGDVVELEAGVHPTLTSKLQLRANGTGASRIKIKTAGTFPTTRVTEAQGSSFAQITGPAASAVIGCDLAASRYTLENIQVNGQPGRTIIETHYVPATSVSQVPFDIEYERVLVMGHTDGSLRGISLNGANIDVRRCMTRNIKMTTNGDTQALAGWAGPGPFDIIDCDLEACGENILFGGAKTGITGLIPSDILIEDCDLFKRLEWRGVFVVKNIFELKNAQRVTMRNCRLKYCWTSGQTGWAIVLTPTPVSETDPDYWVKVNDVLIEGCRVTSVGGVVNGLGRHRFDYGENVGVVFRDNLFEDVKKDWGGHGALVQLGGGCRNYQFIDNIADHYGDNVIMLENAIRVSGTYQNLGLLWSTNLHKQGATGIFGSATGQAALDLRAPDAVVNPNRVGGRTSKWPAQDTGATIAMVNWQSTYDADVAAWEASGPPASDPGVPGTPPEFGKTSIGLTANNFPAANSLSLSRFELTTGQTFSHLYIYFNGIHANHEGGPAKGVVYATDGGGFPGALLKQTQEVFVPDGIDGWVGLPFDSLLTLASGFYYLGIWSGNRLIGAMDSAGVNYYRLSVNYDGPGEPPNPFGTPTSSGYQKSIYALQGLSITTLLNADSGVYSVQLIQPGGDFAPLRLDVDPGTYSITGKAIELGGTNQLSILFDESGNILQTESSTDFLAESIEALLVFTGKGGVVLTGAGG